MLVKITPRELEFLSHRLEVSDAIAETLIDSELGYSSAVCVAGIADGLLYRLTKSGVIDCEALTALERDIITDCFEGSTWFVGITQEARDTSKPQLVSGARRTISRLTEKLHGAGLDVPAVPDY